MRLGRLLEVGRRSTPAVAVTGRRERCPCCAAPDGAWRPWATLEGLDLVTCGECTHRFVAQAIAPAALAAYYAPEYFDRAVYLDYAGDVAAHDANALRYLALVRGRHPGGRLVEVGAAYGFFLSRAAAVYEAAGVELSDAARAACVARGLVCVPSVEALPARFRGATDVVALWDTIEHLHDPDEVLRGARALLRPGGSLYVTTGDASSRNAVRRGPRWRLVDLPQHLHYFTPRSLARLGERLGLRADPATTLPHTRSVASMLNGVGQRQRGLLGAALRVGARLCPRRATLTLDLGDVMLVRLEAV